jgi:hydrogenase nickel insertion protein HypA
MHEAAIAKNILQFVNNRIAETPYIEKATKVQVLIGELRNVDDELLKFEFDCLKTLYPGCSSCHLEIESIKAKAFCNKSKHLYHPESELKYRCTKCGGDIGNLVCGEELDVMKVTLKCLLNAFLT